MNESIILAHQAYGLSNDNISSKNEERFSIVMSEIKAACREGNYEVTINCNDLNDECGVYFVRKLYNLGYDVNSWDSTSKRISIAWNRTDIRRTTI